MTEKLPACGVDAIGPAAEINLVEIQLQNLPLGEFPLQR
jgi:hypothetical protein